MNNRFFNPYIGAHYKQGLIKGKKVLILGASHYCNKKECQKWKECTSNTIKDSSKFNENCPYYKSIGWNEKLEDTTKIEIGNFLDFPQEYTSYKNFTEAMKSYCQINSNEEFWERVALVNYVQYFVPSFITPQQTKSDIRNFKALLETLDELNPDIIIMWGVEIRHHFEKSYIKQLVDKIEFCERRESTDSQYNDYIIDIEYNGNKYLFINPYHPCDFRGNWSNNLLSFNEVLRLIL